MPSSSVLGLDIGGANLKAAHTNGTACLMPFELWKAPDRLQEALGDLLKLMPKFDLLAVTMTGELCDCFETKRQGVVSILDSLVIAANHIPIRIWTTSGFFLCPKEAKDQHLRIASANWLALATFVGRYVPSGSSLLVDIGSTTTDIVPLVDGKPVPQGRTDFERLHWGELVYTGVRRTPVCALLRGEGAAELFASTHDVYLILGEVKEDPKDFSTADGHPATRHAALARLARMVCMDLETFPEREVVSLAGMVCERQMELLRECINLVIEKLPSQPGTIIVSGSGEFLARKVLDNMVSISPAEKGIVLKEVNAISLTDKLCSEISRAACAYAVAVLAQESVIN
jgi:probable H4MPT-linked C1 transfer pathway protein